MNSIIPICPHCRKAITGTAYAQDKSLGVNMFFCLNCKCVLGFAIGPLPAPMPLATT